LDWQNKNLRQLRFEPIGVRQAVNTILETLW
jgi:hypothetical protein